MDHQEFNEPKSSQGSGWAFWLLTVFGLTPFFPVVAFLVLLAGLFFLCGTPRWVTVVFGLTLAVSCGIGAMLVMSDPEMAEVAPTGLLFLPWAGFGLWLAAKGLSEK